MPTELELSRAEALHWKKQYASAQKRVEWLEGVAKELGDIKASRIYKILKWLKLVG